MNVASFASSQRGLSSAVLRGFAEAQGQILLCMDADLQHPPTAVPKMYKELTSFSSSSSAPEFVIGTRYGSDTFAVDKEWAIHRVIMSKGARALARPLTPLSDPMTGFFAITRAAYERGLPKVNPIGFKIAMVRFIVDLSSILYFFFLFFASLVLSFILLMSCFVHNRAQRLIRFSAGNVREKRHQEARRGADFLRRAPVRPLQAVVKSHHQLCITLATAVCLSFPLFADPPAAVDCSHLRRLLQVGAQALSVVVRHSIVFNRADSNLASIDSLVGFSVESGFEFARRSELQAKY